MKALTTFAVTLLIAILAALALSASPNLDRLDARKQAQNVTDAQMAAQARARLVSSLKRACGTYREYQDGSIECGAAK